MNKRRNKLHRIKRYDYLIKKIRNDIKIFYNSEFENVTIALALTIVTFLIHFNHWPIVWFSRIGTHRNFLDETTLGNEPTLADGGWNLLSTQNLIVEIDRDLPYRSSWDNGKEISSFLCWSHQFGPRRLKDRHDWLADREIRTVTSGSSKDLIVRRSWIMKKKRTIAWNARNYIC